MAAERAEKVYEELAALYDDGSDYGGLSQLAHAEQAAYQAALAEADDATVCAALLHDVGWKLAGATPFEIDASTGLCCRKRKRTGGTETRDNGGGEQLNAADNDVADACAPAEDSIASRLGILTTCAAAGSTAESLRAQHDSVGGCFLRMRGFKEKVPHLVEGHVLAKRYLCFKEKDYHDKLSKGSKRTLIFQGGPMTEAEAAIFEADPLFEQSKQMRRWDEAAKDAGLKIPVFKDYKDIIIRCITEPAKTAEETLKTCTFVREGNTIVGIREEGASKWINRTSDTHP